MADQEKKTMATLVLKAKCISCGHAWKLSNQDIKNAQELGAATCSKCMGIAIVTSATTRKRRSRVPSE